MNCKYCKFYEKTDWCDEFGYCNSGKMVYMNAYRISKENMTKNRISLDMLVYMDGDGFDTQPIVGESFGCVNFEGTQEFVDSTRRYD